MDPLLGNFLNLSQGFPLPLVPKLRLGTHLFAKLCFANQTLGNRVAKNNCVPNREIGNEILYSFPAISFSPICSRSAARWAR